MAFNTRMGRAVLELSIEGGAFVRGAADAKATMRDLARGIADTQRQIGKQAFAFSGRAQIADAAKMAEAVRSIGGVTRLVTADQAKYNAVLKQGIEYLRTQGKEVPKLWLEHEKATRKAASAVGDFEKALFGVGGAAGMVTSALAGAFSVSAIVGAAKAALAYGEALEKAGIAAGGTAAQAQRLENIAVGSNTTLDSLIRALTTMQDRVSGGDTATIDALKELGIDAERLLELSPDEQLIAISNALQQIQSHERQIKLGKDIFGPATVEIFGALSNNAGKLADNIKKLTDSEVQQLADLQQQWDSLAKTIQRTALSIIIPNINGMLGRFTAGQGRPPVEPARMISPGGADRINLPPNYSRQLREAQDALKGLTKETVSQIAAAKQLSTTTDKDLLRVLDGVGVSGDRAKNVLKLLEDQLGKTKKGTSEASREWQQMLERFNGAPSRVDAQKLAAAIATGQLNLARMTEDAQQAISKALDEGAEAWKRWGGVVPAEINRARAAVAQLPLMLAELRKLETAPGAVLLGEPFGDAEAQRGVDTDLKRMGGQVAGMDTGIAGGREHAKAQRDMDISRSEAAIKQAEREGAKKVQILIMESRLEQKKRDAELADQRESLGADEAALRLRLERGEMETSEFTAELERRQQQYADHVDAINETWAQGEAERRDMIRRESSFWASELGKSIKGELQGILHEATGRIASTLFARGDGEAKKRAKEAREDYERIARSGRASAEEITRAFRAMREAEEQANGGWAKRFTAMWDGIKRHIFNIFDSILEQFVNNFLKGLLNSFLGTGFGKKLGGMFGQMLGGAGGGGGFEIPGVGGGIPGIPGIPGLGGRGGLMPSLLSKIPGLGFLAPGIATTAFSAATASTLGASMIAPSIASAAVPAAIASQGASAAVAASVGAGSAGAAGAAGATGGAAAGGGGALSGLGGLLTNPWTIGIAGAILGGLALWKSGFGRGGEEGVFVNPERDKYFKRHPHLGEDLIKVFMKQGLSFEQASARRVQLMDKMLFAADTKKEFAAATTAIDAALAGKPFQTADFTKKTSPWHPQRMETHHTGGIVGQMDAARTATRERLKPNEIIIKALKGEGVLTPKATAMIGGKPIIDLLNAGNVDAIKDALARGDVSKSDVAHAVFEKVAGPREFSGSMGASAPAAPDAMPIAEMLKSGQQHDVIAAVKRGDVKASDIFRAIIQAKGGGGSFLGAITGASARVATSVRPTTFSPAIAAIDRSLSMPNVLRDTAALQPPSVSTRPDPSDGPGGGPRHTTIKFEIKALDGADVEKIVRQKVAPKLRWMIGTDQDSMGSVVKKAALT